MFLHSMDGAVPRPSPECLALVIEQDAEKAPEQNQGRIRHDWWNVSISDDPIGDELAESVSPNVLVDRNGDKQAAGDGLVAVNGIGGNHAGNSCDLDAGASVADDHDHLPGPFLLVAHTHDDIAQVHDDHVRDHGRQTHFRLSNASVLGCGASGYPI